MAKTAVLDTDATEAVKAFAGARGLKFDEAASALVVTGYSRQRALSKYGKKVKKEAKEATKKPAKKAAKKAKPAKKAATKKAEKPAKAKKPRKPKDVPPVVPDAHEHDVNLED